MDKELIDLCEKKIAKAISTKWSDLAIQFGYKNSDAIRVAYVNYRRLNGILPSREDKVSQIISDKLTDIELAQIELKKEKIKMQDQRNALNKLIRESARYESIIDVIRDSIKESNLQELTIKKSTNPYLCGEYEMVACFSDFHYGLCVDNYWNKFNEEVFKSRLEKYIEKIIEISHTFMIKRIVVMGLGDMISGNIHTGLIASNLENVVNQTKKVAEYIAQAIHKLAKHFEVVDYYSAIGNHGRTVANKHDAVSNENFEDFINWWLVERLQKCENVTIHENDVDKDIIVAKVKNHTIYGCHGDKDKIKTVVQDLTLMVGEIPKSCYVGHMHHYAEDVVQGVDVIMSGCIIGTDDYAKDIRKIGYSSQTVCVYNEFGKVCSFNVRLS